MQQINDKTLDRKNELKELRQSFGEFIFWITFLLLLIIHCIENTSLIYLNVPWINVMYRFRNCLYLLLMAKIGFWTTYQKEELLGLLLIGLIGVASLFGSKDFGLLEFCIVVIAAKDVAPRTLVKVFAVIKGSAVLATLFLWSVGILEALYYQDDVYGFYNTYGFCHRNVLGANVAVLCLAWFYLRYQKINWKDVVVWTFIGNITYVLALSRTSLLVTFLIIIGVYGFQEYEKQIMNIPNMKKMLLYFFIAMLSISLICMLFYDSNDFLWKIIDKIFTKRARFANQCFQRYGLSLFGEDIPFVSSMSAQSADTKKLILDNSYARVILYYGVIPGAMFLKVFFQGVKQALRREDKALLLSLLIISVYGLSERYMLDVYYNIPLVVSCLYMLKEIKLGQTEEEKTPLQYLPIFISWLKEWKAKQEVKYRRKSK